jgi:hypothetical protein
MTRSPSFRDGFVDRLSGFSFLPPYYPSYRALASTLARLSSLNAPAFRWTHLHAGLSRRTVMAFYEKVIKVKADVAAFLINCFPFHLSIGITLRW